ncbi:hypothetical protein JK211_14535 [Tatumella sp. JGM130]|uniref:hypothetical protein n=1 Tax=Tatumella sp. JGM130 TaxID=2799797 RepID=UPI001BAF45A2|nr:hypothetical protein [Tatumella sp. JGM130]MBS0895232.1 hypothetical protein [Tatumella sp. JGM130]
MESIEKIKDLVYKDFMTGKLRTSFDCFVYNDLFSQKNSSYTESKLGKMNDYYQELKNNKTSNDNSYLEFYKIDIPDLKLKEEVEKGFFYLLNNLDTEFMSNSMLLDIFNALPTFDLKIEFAKTQKKFCKVLSYTLDFSPSIFKQNCEKDIKIISKSVKNNYCKRVKKDKKYFPKITKIQEKYLVKFMEYLDFSVQNGRQLTNIFNSFCDLGLGDIFIEKTLKQFFCYPKNEELCNYHYNIISKTKGHITFKKVNTFLTEYVKNSESIILKLKCLDFNTLESLDLVYSGSYFFDKVETFIERYKNQVSKTIDFLYDFNKKTNFKFIELEEMKDLLSINNDIKLNRKTVVELEKEFLLLQNKYLNLNISSVLMTNNLSTKKRAIKRL